MILLDINCMQYLSNLLGTTCFFANSIYLHGKTTIFMVESPCLMVKTTMKSWGLCRAGNHPRAPEDRFEIGRSWLCAGRTFGQRGPACATSLWCGEEAGRAKYCQWDLSIDFAENSMSFARLVDYVGHRH